MLFFKAKIFRKFSKTLFYIDIANIVLVLLFFFLLPKFYCNIMSIRNVNLCANLNKKPNPKAKPIIFHFYIVNSPILLCFDSCFA